MRLFACCETDINPRSLVRVRSKGPSVFFSHKLCPLADLQALRVTTGCMYVVVLVPSCMCERPSTSAETFMLSRGVVLQDQERIQSLSKNKGDENAV